MELNNMESIGSLINSLTGEGKAGGLGDISKLTGLLGTKGLGIGIGNKFPIILILLLLVLFGNRGGYGNNPQQYECYCYKKKYRKHHRRCCYGNYGSGNQSYGCGYGTNRQGGIGGFGGGSNIIFIIILLVLIQVGKKSYPVADSATGNIFNFNSVDELDTNDDYVITDPNEEE